MKKVTMDVKAFIIPNHAGKLSRRNAFLGLEERVAFINSIIDLNCIDIPYPLDEPLVEIWWHCVDGEGYSASENICDHGVKIDGVRHNIYRIDLVPATVFKGHKEGDTFTLKFVKKAYLNSGFDESEDIEFTWNVTLDQLNYRYRNFGPFEKALETVLS